MRFVKSRSKRLDLFSFPQEKVAKYIAEKYPFRPDAQEIAAAVGYRSLDRGNWGE